jgi:hypothetical protein
MGKKLLVLLTAFLFVGFDNPKDPDIVLKATKITPLTEDKCNVTLELHNESSQKINYLSMYCSTSGFYITDNPNVKVTPKPCGKNFPISAPIAAHQYRILDLDMEILKNTKEAKFRIGFKFIEIPKTVKLEEFDSTTVKSITIWSNAITYKMR